MKTVEGMIGGEGTVDVGGEALPGDVRAALGGLDFVPAVEDVFHHPPLVEQAGVGGAQLQPGVERGERLVKLAATAVGGPFAVEGFNEARFELACPPIPLDRGGVVALLVAALGEIADCVCVVRAERKGPSERVLGGRKVLPHRAGNAEVVEHVRVLWTKRQRRAKRRVRSRRIAEQRHHSALVQQPEVGRVDA